MKANAKSIEVSRRELLGVLMHPDRKSSWPLRTVPLLSFVVVLLFACAKDTSSPVEAPVASITVVAVHDTVLVGDSIQLIATTKDSKGQVLTGRTVTWASENPAVAKVSSAGVVTGVGAGSATVTATSEGHSAVAMVTVLSPGAPQVFDAVADYSSTTNTNSSTWSYRYQTGLIRDGNYPLLTDYGPADPGTWIPANPDAWSIQGDPDHRLPSIGLNGTGSAVTVPGSENDLSWPDGTIRVHPGISHLVILSWLSAAEAMTTIEFSFTHIHANCGDGIDWIVELNNDGATLSSGSIDGAGSSGPRSVSAVHVQAGDRINFIVGPKSDYYCDSTTLTATITATAVR